MAITDTQTKDWYDSAVTSRKQTRVGMVGEQPQAVGGRNSKTAPKTPILGGQDMLPKPEESGDAVLGQSTFQPKPYTPEQDRVQEQADFGGGVLDEQELTPAPQSFDAAPVMQDPNLTEGGAVETSNFGGTTADYNAQPAGTPSPTSDYNKTYNTATYAPNPNVGTSYFQPQGSLKGTWDTMAQDTSKYGGDTKAVNTFLVNGLRDGWTPEQIDADMGWPAGTSAQWVADNGINVENKLGPNGLYQMASNDLQEGYNGLVRAVNAGEISADEAINSYMSAALQIYTPAQIDHGLQLEGFAQNWVDNNQVVTGGQGGGIVGGGTFTSTTIDSPNIGGDTGPVETIAPDGAVISMEDATNIGVTNVMAAREAATGTMAAESDALAQYYDENALYVPKESQMLSTTLNDILAEDSPYLQVAETRALEEMSARGLTGSSMHAGAAARAAIEAALPIAQGDVQASAFNAEQYNRMMDRRQSQYGDLVGTAQRGSIDFLKTMQNSVNGLIEADVKHTFDLDYLDKEEASKMKLNNVQYYSQAWGATQQQLAAIQNSDLSPEAKKAKYNEVMKSFARFTNNFDKIADGIDLTAEDLGLVDVEETDKRDVTYPNSSYKSSDYDQFTSQELKAGDTVSQFASEQYDAARSMLEAPDDAGVTQEQKDWAMKVDYLYKFSDSTREQFPDTWAAAMRKYDGTNSLSNLSSVTETMKLAWEYDPDYQNSDGIGENWLDEHI